MSRPVRQPLFHSSLAHQFDLTRTGRVNHDADYRDIAAKCGIEEPSHRCYLKYATTSHVYLEPVNAVARQYKAIDALIKCPNSKHTAKMDRVSSYITSIFSCGHGDETRACTIDKRASHQHLALGHPWETVCQGAEVVDVGGGTGNTTSLLAERHPHLRIVVQGLSETLENVNLPSNRNVRLMAHDMLATQSVVEADVFMFQWVLHRLLVDDDFDVAHSDKPAMTDSV